MIAKYETGSNSQIERIALFPGSFNPFTVGHADIVERSAKLFDKIVIGIGFNFEKGKPENLDEKIKILNDYYKTRNPKVCAEGYTGLTADFARKIGASVLIRGIRDVRDFEYERNIADANREIADLDTIYFSTRPEYSYISSSLLRELESYGRDITPYLGVPLAKELKNTVSKE